MARHEVWSGKRFGRGQLVCGSRKQQGVWSRFPTASGVVTEIPLSTTGSDRPVATVLLCCNLGQRAYGIGQAQFPRVIPLPAARTAGAGGIHRSAYDKVAGSGYPGLAGGRLVDHHTIRRRPAWHAWGPEQTMYACWNKAMSPNEVFVLKPCFLHIQGGDQSPKNRRGPTRERAVVRGR